MSKLALTKMKSIEDVFHHALAIGFGILTSFFAIHALLLSSIYCRFVAPISTVSTNSNGDRDTPYLRSFLSLAGVYISVALVLAYTGGTIGMTSASWTPENQTHLMWGFTTGMLVVAIARISAIYITTSLASYLLLLTVFAAGAIAYRFALDYRFFTKPIDNVLRPAGGGYFIAFALCSVLGAIIIVEGAIWFEKFLPSRSDIPYALLTERIQQFTTIRQIFLPSSVVESTDAQVKKIISTEGLSELLWVTHTAPNHLNTIAEALRNRPDNIAGDEWKKIKSCSKVVLASSSLETAGEFQEKLGASFKHLARATRVRYLIINRRHAIVHLPIPYTSREGEESNCAHVIKSMAQVSMWRQKFYDLWDGIP